MATLPATSSAVPTGAGSSFDPAPMCCAGSASELQVGLDPRRALVLPDRPEVRALLDRLARPAAPPSGEPYDERALEALAENGLLIDADVLLPLVPAPTRNGGSDVAGGRVSRTEVATLAACAGDRVPTMLERRARLHVDVLACGSAEAAPVADEVVTLLSSAGVHPCLVPHCRPPAPEQESALPARAAAGLLVAVGEPSRDHLDAWMRAGTPHLLLRLTEGHAVVGPFVRPGETACLRCVDAHHTDADPAWPLLVAQSASAVGRPRDDTVPEPVDTLLATLAGAWAARELVSYAEGRVPATTAATLRLDPQLTALQMDRWPRHPACGCAWG